MPNTEQAVARLLFLRPGACRLGSTPLAYTASSVVDLFVHFLVHPGIDVVIIAVIVLDLYDLSTSHCDFWHGVRHFETTKGSNGAIRLLAGGPFGFAFKLRRSLVLKLFERRDTVGMFDLVWSLVAGVRARALGGRRSRRAAFAG